MKTTTYKKEETMTFKEATYKAMGLSINKGSHVVLLYIPGNTYHVFSWINWDRYRNMVKETNLKLVAIYE